MQIHTRMHTNPNSNHIRIVFDNIISIWPQGSVSPWRQGCGGFWAGAGSRTIQLVATKTNKNNNFTPTQIHSVPIPLYDCSIISFHFCLFLFVAVQTSTCFVVLWCVSDGHPGPSEEAKHFSRQGLLQRNVEASLSILRLIKTLSQKLGSY